MHTGLAVLGPYFASELATYSLGDIMNHLTPMGHRPYLSHGVATF